MNADNVSSRFSSSDWRTLRRCTDNILNCGTVLVSEYYPLDAKEHNCCNFEGGLLLTFARTLKPTYILHDVRTVDKSCGVVNILPLIFACKS